MNSDESDFDWDEDVNIDESGQVHKKKLDKNSNSHWRKLSPFLRMVIMVLVGSPIVALPAILVSVLMDDDAPDPVYPTKATVKMIFVWLSFMWGIIFITNWGIDIVPVVVVRLTSFVTSSRSEDLRSRLLIFVAAKKYLKWLLASCWAIGSFAFLSQSVYSRTNREMGTIFLEVLGCLVAGCALVFIEKILLHLISTNFHQTAYADRIKENKYALTVLDRLSTSKKNNVKHPKGGGARPTHSRHNTADNVNLQNMSMHNNTATEYAFPTGYHSAQASRSNSIEPNNSRQSTLVPSIRNPRNGQRDSKIRTGENNNIFKGINRRLHGIALASKTSPSKDIGSTANAKRLAKTLFYNLQSTSGNRDDLVVESFYPYFATQEEARTAFAIFDKDGNGDISKAEMKEKIFYVYKERKDLHTSLRDLSQAVGKLDVIFLTIVTLIWLLIILSVFGKDVVKNMLSIGSFLLALSFVFGNSLKMLFENIVFLFITHPYDSGDLVSIEGVDMYVREVGLNSTTFVTWDGKRMYYPNNLISSKPIHNVRRSPNMTDKIVLNIDCYTPQFKIFELRARMRDYLIRESKDFLPDLEIQIQEMDAKLKISMCIEHKGNWQDSGRRWARRTAFNYALKEAVEEIGIQYYALPQRMEVYERGNVPMRDLSLDTSRGQNGIGGEGGESAEAALGPNSPLRQYSPEHIARLYRRTTVSKPQGEGGE
ncbi:MAG: Mechanosensitive ion channel-domain-containing protein [Linnemannia gamsii]|nr:MAG: Mechanosensitive ion channel-domain-containing protein [Linnemannia gamsii]